MRKIFVLLLALVMVFAMVACKEPDSNGSGGGGSSMPVSKDAGKDALIEQGSSGSKAIDHTGFSFAIQSTVGETTEQVWIGGKDDVYWVSLDGTEYEFFTEKNDKTYYYVTGESPAWYSVAQGSLKASLFGPIVDSLLYSAHAAEKYLTKGEDDTVSNRSCATYSASMSMQVAESQMATMNVKYWVDKEFGVTMKIEYEDSNLNNNYASSMTFTLTPTFSNPTLPSGYAAAKANESFVNII